MSENGCDWEAPVCVNHALLRIQSFDVFSLLHQPAVQPQKSLLTSLNLSFLIYEQQVILSFLPSLQVCYND